MSLLSTVLCGRLARLVVDEYVRWADQHPRVKAIYIFGSIARGDCRPTSDVDIYVEMALCQHTAIFLLENRLSRIQAKQEPIWIECFRVRPHSLIEQIQQTYTPTELKNLRQRKGVTPQL